MFAVVENNGEMIAASGFQWGGGVGEGGLSGGGVVECAADDTCVVFDGKGVGLYDDFVLCIVGWDKFK